MRDDLETKRVQKVSDPESENLAIGSMMPKTKEPGVPIYRNLSVARLNFPGRVELHVYTTSLIQLTFGYSRTG
jgi:hypothetical protein